MSSFKYKLKEVAPDGFEVGNVSTDGDFKSTVTDINPETGTVSWILNLSPI